VQTCSSHSTPLTCDTHAEQQAEHEDDNLVDDALQHAALGRRNRTVLEDLGFMSCTRAVEQGNQADDNCMQKLPFLFFPLAGTAAAGTYRVWMIIHTAKTIT
jgi:hypothetical protein